eukprot:CAMPEP_0180115882 /NCGR_PEP_ID=MMETSP0986-20121125/40_1 /TAXON_ID=697907 /ORGANISM="non described non described, Strain CCMP2293" /LENGTH=180 /DNA_ID=CAMNT_0022054555 /DNA_START=30 /DNA_END=569 /DNA_ORIENTATION=-
MGKGAGGPGEWTTAEQLVLTEAVHRLGAGAVPDFVNVIARAVRAAMTYPGATKRAPEFFEPKKCETKWREILALDDARRGAAGRQGRQTPSERAGEIFERIRDIRKAEIKSGLARINADIADIDRGLDPGAAGSTRAMEQEAAAAPPPAAAPRAPEPVAEKVVAAPRQDDRARDRKGGGG